jgi:hypothetical protein
MSVAQRGRRERDLPCADANSRDWGYGEMVNEKQTGTFDEPEHDAGGAYNLGPAESAAFIRRGRRKMGSQL